MPRHLLRNFFLAPGLWMLILGNTPSFARTHEGFDALRDSPAQSENLLFADDFNNGTLDFNKWRLGTNSGNRSKVANGKLELRSQGSQSGWVITRDAFAARNSTVTVKVVQPNGDGDLGISPTYTLSSIYGIYNEPAWYRFYTYRSGTSGPYRLYAQWKKNGTVDGVDVTGNLVINGPVYLRLRMDDSKIHFEASLDGVAWLVAYSEPFSLSGYTLDNTFHYELAAYKTKQHGVLVVDDFSITTLPAGPNSTVTILTDPLNGSTLGIRTGGSFVANGGWQVVAPDNMIVYDVGRYIENGSLEMDVRNFDPRIQNAMERHHFLAMFRHPWGNHHPAEELETLWDLHAGANYSGGVKMLSSTYQEDESNTILPTPTWDANRTYHVKVTWEGNQLQYFRDGILYATHTHSASMQLRYLFLGRDLTVSGDLVTNYKNNQYPAIIGPIYANLVVKRRIESTEATPPLVSNITPSALYANAARISWNTDEAATCRVEYGPSASYGNSTVVLGPPATTHETTLAGLASNQTYHFRIIARDAEGNTTVTEDYSFTTSDGGDYLFPPVADTFVEADGIYGPTRSYANFGWMHLLLSEGRECYLRFDLTGISGNIVAAVLRLHGRQSGGGGTVSVLGSNWNEPEVTWRTRPAIPGPVLGNLPAVTAGQWSEVSVISALNGNGTYNFALTSASSQATPVGVASLDSRESPSFQPELVIQVSGVDQTPPGISMDDFNGGTLDPNKWLAGNNSGNLAAVVNNALALRSQGAQSGWVITREAFVARNSTITVKVLQPNDDGDLGMSPTYTLSSIYGIYNEPTWYRFYTYRNQPAGSYRLFVQWKKNGTVDGLDVTGNLVINGPVHLRLRLDDSQIHFEASLDGVAWTDTYSETFSLPGYTLDNTFHYELAGYRTELYGELVVDDFFITTGTTNLDLILTSPNGGEWWFAGANREITWRASSAIANVMLALSTNGGVSWSTIVASTPNDGSYSWLVPEPISNTCLIRISNASDGSPSDVNDGTFFITRSAFINFTLSENNPVLSPGPPGSWDENIRERGWFMYENGMYHVWYGGWQGAYDYRASNLVKLGYAYSTDGVHWTKYAGNPIYDQNWMEDVVVVKDGSIYYLYAEDEFGNGNGTHIDLYTSTNKVDWTRYGTVLSRTGNGWESLHVGTPTVWKEAGTWYVLYEGIGNATAGQVGLATSLDGKNWTRNSNNPVLSNPQGTDLDIAIDSIIKISGVYYAYGHYDTGGHNWVGGLFTSTDLISWTAYPGNPLPYNSPVIVDNGTNYLMYSLASNSSGLAPYNLATSTHTTSVSTIAAKTADANEIVNDIVATSLPDRIALYPNYPNPLRLDQSGFHTETKIVYQLPERSHVKLALYDLLGRELKILVDAEREAGTYAVGWDGRDASGNLLPSGFYMYAIQVGSFRNTKKLVIVR